MAHMQKFTRGQTGRMFNHFERTENDGVDRSNKNIDSSKTHENYNLAKDLQPLSGTDFLKQRVFENPDVKCINRKDVNVMIDWVITKPKNVPNDAQSTKDFFSATFDFMCNRYGKENVISAYVHMDETTPHMHFSFVPILRNEVTGKENVSAWKVVNRYDLQTFHDDLAKDLENTLGYRPDVVRPAEERDRVADLSLDEYKRMQSEKKLSDLDAKIENAQEAVQNAKVLVDTYNDAKVVYADLQNKVNDLQEQIENKQEVLNVLSASINVSEVSDISGKEKKNPITGKETIELTKDDFNKLKTRAMRTETNERFIIEYSNSEPIKEKNDYKKSYDNVLSTLQVRNGQLNNERLSHQIDVRDERKKTETAHSETIEAKKELNKVLTYCINVRDELDNLKLNNGATIKDLVDKRLEKPQALQDRIDDLKNNYRDDVEKEYAANYVPQVSRDWDDFER